MLEAGLLEHLVGLVVVQLLPEEQAQVSPGYLSGVRPVKSVEGGLRNKREKKKEEENKWEREQRTGKKRPTKIKTLFMYVCMQYYIIQYRNDTHGGMQLLVRAARPKTASR